MSATVSFSFMVNVSIFLKFGLLNIFRLQPELFPNLKSDLRTLFNFPLKLFCLPQENESLKQVEF